MSVEPDKSFLESAIEFLCAGFFLIGMGGAASRVSEEVWWRIAIGPTVEKIETSIKDGDLASAEAVLIASLRVFPADAALNYSAVGLYLLSERPLHALFYRSVYLRLGDANSDRANRIAVLTSDLESSLQTELEEALGLTEEVYNSLGSQRKFAKLTDIQRVMSAPASSFVGEPGYFYPRNPLPCGEKQRCGFSFENADLFGAVRTQIARSTDPRGGSDCCALDFADKDLRPLQRVQDEYIQDIKAADPGFELESADGALRMAQFRARLLMKQFYFIRFAERAAYRSALDPEPDSRWYARAAGYVLWAILSAILYIVLDAARNWILARK